MRWCSVSEHCKYDVHLWLLRHKTEHVEDEKIINYLVSKGFLDEKRYADAFVHDKFVLNGWGCRKIIAALRAKEISEKTIEEAIQHNIDKTLYVKTLTRLLKKKKKSLKDDNIGAIKQKMLNFAISKGFEPELIHEIINQLEE